MKDTGFHIPFIDHLGIEIVHFGDGQSELRYAPKPEHGNSYGVAHGGAQMTLLDVSMAVAVMEPDRPEVGGITVEMKTSFMRAAKGVLTCKGRVMHRTRTLSFVEATVFNEAGEACAQATGTFVLRERSSGAEALMWRHVFRFTTPVIGSATRFRKD